MNNNETDASEDAIDGCVIDLDGTLTLGDGLTRGARELVAATGGAFVVLSNNSSHSATDLATELAALELDVPPARILLAGAHAVALLGQERPGERVLLLGSPALERLAVAAGLVLDEDRPRTVLLARDERFSYPRFARAANAVRHGAQFMVANADLTHPGPDGGIVPETGALLAAFRACCPDAPCRVIGKPEAALFADALRILGTRPERTLVIGDNAATDGEGARRTRMPFLHVFDCDVSAAAAVVHRRMRHSASKPRTGAGGPAVSPPSRRHT